MISAARSLNAGHIASEDLQCSFAVADRQILATLSQELNASVGWRRSTWVLGCARALGAAKVSAALTQIHGPADGAAIGDGQSVGSISLRAGHSEVDPRGVMSGQRTPTPSDL